MIAAAITLVFLQASAAGAAAQQSQPVVRRQGFVTAAPEATYPEALLPMVQEYQRCLHPAGRTVYDPGAGYEGATRARLADCSAVRDWAISSALTAYKAGHKTEQRSSEQVEAIFERLDKQALLNARYFDKLEAGEVPPPRPGEVIVLSEDNDAPNQ
ncbi:MAG TPA: hypothetical protein VF662_11025 [Allosphingosinicella sp.]|jgi:hypothetical protein